VPGVNHGDVDPVKVERTFFVGDRLERLPAKRSKRLVVLDRIAQEFVPGVRYHEAQVDARLKEFHPDHAALRRALVDEGFLERESGIYWRSGGSVPV
jgi:hypothetical protein